MGGSDDPPCYLFGERGDFLILGLYILAGALVFLDGGSCDWEGAFSSFLEGGLGLKKFAFWAIVAEEVRDIKSGKSCKD